MTKEVDSLLAELGDSPGVVAESLRQMGVRGDTHDHERAPLAVYLTSVVGADPLIEGVATDDVTVRLTLRARQRASVRVALPLPVSRFAIAFDQGLYPALVTRHRDDRGPG